MLRGKAKASGRAGYQKTLWKAVAKLSRRPPTPPRGKLAIKGRASGNVKPEPIVVPRVLVKEEVEEVSSGDTEEAVPVSPIERAVKSGTRVLGGRISHQSVGRSRHGQ